MLDKTEKKILVVGMPGAGNLGDDLISVLLIRHLQSRFPDARVGVLTHDRVPPIPCDASEAVTCLYYPRLNRNYLTRRNAIKRWLADTELILVGGGGLFQDSHFLFTILRYIRYGFMGQGAKCPLVAVGVGVGPIRRHLAWSQLQLAISRIQRFQVRDQASAQIVADRNGQPVLCSDVVAGSSIEGLGWTTSPTNSPAVGCSIRPWPGIDMGNVLRLLLNLCKERGLACKLFVFENAPGNATEREFAEQLGDRLQNEGVEAKTYSYGVEKWADFANAFASVERAVAVRYHANILWQKLNVPVLPIAYAPKVASLYTEHGSTSYAIDDLAELVGADEEFKRIHLVDDYQLPDLDWRTQVNVSLLDRGKACGFDCLDFLSRCVGILGRAITR